MISKKFYWRIEKLDKEKQRLNKSIKSLSTLRLLSFLFLPYLIYQYTLSSYSDLYFSLIFIDLIIFVSLIVYHNKLKDRLSRSKILIDINNQYLQRINGKWIKFPDFGEEFIDRNHRYSYDLDIVGPNSLFQKINLSNTWIGRQSLASDLLNTKYEKLEILNRQEAIKELSLKLDFIQCLEYENRKKLNIKNPKDIISYFGNYETSTYSKNKTLFIKLLPVLTLVSTTTILYFQLEKLHFFPLILIGFQISLCLMGSKKNQKTLEGVGSFKDNLEVYLGMLRAIEREDFNSSLLKEEKSLLFSGQGAIKIIKKLDMISEKINVKHTGLLYLLLNVFLLWDYKSVFSLENWMNEYAAKIEVWMDSIGRIQSLSSLSVLLLVENDVCFPTLHDEKSVISKSCGHPLLQSENRVNNDIDIRDNILIITGSNMSGKTTFLRTIGINLVLLNSGSVTISKEFQAPIMNVYTSMRITDDLKNNVSTFYAELLRIKDILDYAKDNNNTIFLIDEIFNGTNSKDRILGAKNVLMNLNKLGLLGAITTHDFELCQLDVFPRIKNYHFAEDYTEASISFDYKIKTGKSKSTNARHLMELVGIEIID